MAICTVVITCAADWVDKEHVYGLIFVCNLLLWIIFLVKLSLFVTARMRKPQDGLFTGQIDAVDTANYTYRVTFDRPGLDRIYILLYHNLMLYEAWKKSSKGHLKSKSLMTKLNWNTKWGWSTSLVSFLWFYLAFKLIVKLRWIVAEFCSTVNILPLFTLVEKQNNNLFVLYTQSDFSNTWSQHNYTERNYKI